MYMYLEYKSAATIGQWWNLSNHSGNIQIDTVTNKGNNSSLLCDYITQCNYHSSYFPQSLNFSRGHYFTAVDYLNCTKLLLLNSFWKLLWLLSVSQNNIKQVYLWLLQRSNLFTIEKVPTNRLYSNKWVIYNVYCTS